MSPRALRRRLDRLERAIEKAEQQNKDHIHELQNKDRTHEFTIDPASAKALLFDADRLRDLDSVLRKEPLTAKEIEEKRRLRERISDVASKIALPPGYGLTEAWRDYCRLDALRWRRITNKAFTDAEAIEATQLSVRIMAYKFQSPEGRAWLRIRDLQRKLARLSLDELDELIHLIKLYPPFLRDSHTPLDHIFTGFVWYTTILRDYQERRDRQALAERKKKYPERFY